MNIAKGIYMLSLPIQGFTLHPTVIYDGEEAILVDTGMPGMHTQLLEEVKQNDIQLENLEKVIVTHQDIDHIGCLPEIINTLNHSVSVYSHKLDQPYIEGKKPLLKLDFPPQLQHLVENPPKATVNHSLNGEEELPFCGGIKIIHTPGHSPGHISLYVKESKTLIAGDALICANEKLMGPVPQTTPDMETALTSIKQLLNYEIDQVICFHGGLVKGNIKEQLEQILTVTIEKE